MFTPRLTRVFSSRWRALWWAAGVMFMAWRVAMAGDRLAPDGPPSPPVAQAAPADPWAVDSQ